MPTQHMLTLGKGFSIDFSQDLCQRACLKYQYFKEEVVIILIIHCVLDSSIARRCMRAVDEKKEINLLRPKLHQLSRWLAKCWISVSVFWLVQQIIQDRYEST